MEMDVCDDAHSDMLGRCLAKFLNGLDGGSAANKNNDSGNALSSSGALGSSRQGGGRDNNNRGHNQHNNNNNFSPGRGGRNGRGNFDNRGGGRGHNNNQGRGGRGNNRSLHGAAFDRLNRGRPQDHQIDRNNNNRGQNFDRGGRNGGRMGRSGGRGFGGRDNRGRSGNNNFQQNHHQQQNSDNNNKRKGREEKEEENFVSTALEKGLGAERGNTQQSNKRQRYDDNTANDNDYNMEESSGRGRGGRFGGIGRGVSKSKSISYCTHDAFLYLF